jgi:hypothetical protein
LPKVIVTGMWRSYTRVVVGLIRDHRPLWRLLEEPFNYSYWQGERSGPGEWLGKVEALGVHGHIWPMGEPVSASVGRQLRELFRDMDRAWGAF